MANLADLNDNLFPVANENFSDNLAAGITAGATTVPLNDTAGYDEGDVVVLIVDPKSPEEAVFTGVVVGDALEEVRWTEGNVAVGHDLGSTVADYVTATHLSMVTKGILKQHKQDGSHRDITADSVSTPSLTATEGTLEVTGNLVVSGTTRTTPRVSATATTAVLAPNIDTAGIYDVTALAANMTIANPIGTPKNGDSMVIRFKDNGTSRTIGYGTAYTNISGLDWITATTPNKWHTLGLMYNTSGEKWQISSITTEA